MRPVTVSVIRDPETPGGGGAILRLDGVGIVPPGSKFRIEPGGTAVGDGSVDGPAPEGWPSGEFKPRAQRIVEGGVELVIGPEIVNASALQPGTRVTISIPAVDVRADVEWPDLGAQQPADGPPSEKNTTAATAPLPPPQMPARSPVSTQPNDDDAKRLPSLSELSRLKPSSLPLGGTQLRPATRGPPPSAASQSVVVRPDGPTDKKPKPKPRSHHLLTAIVCLAVGGAAGYAVALRTAPALAPVTVTTAPTVTTTEPAPVISTPLPPPIRTETELAAILDTPATSPLGEPAEGVSLGEAFRRADNRLNGPAADHDRTEAKFWLRRAIALGLGDSRLVWAMTQLGTLYASTDANTPDYRAASLLWELASARGDPVAQCFLASLHEHGLGNAPDRQRALALYENAKAKGGCRGIDEAIARLRGER